MGELHDIFIKAAEAFLKMHPQLATDIETLARDLEANAAKHVQAEIGRKGGQPSEPQQQGSK